MTVAEYVASLECCDSCLCITVCDVIGSRATTERDFDGKIKYVNVYKCRSRLQCGARMGKK